MNRLVLQPEQLRHQVAACALHKASMCWVSRSSSSRLRTISVTGVAASSCCSSAILPVNSCRTLCSTAASSAASSCCVGALAACAGAGDASGCRCCSGSWGTAAEAAGAADGGSGDGRLLLAATAGGSPAAAPGPSGVAALPGCGEGARLAAAASCAVMTGRSQATHRVWRGSVRVRMSGVLHLQAKRGARQSAQLRWLSAERLYTCSCLPPSAPHLGQHVSSMVQPCSR